MNEYIPLNRSWFFSVIFADKCFEVNLDVFSFKNHRNVKFFKPLLKLPDGHDILAVKDRTTQSGKGWASARKPRALGPERRDEDR